MRPLYAGYKLIKTLGTTSFTDTGLVCGTSYTYTVKAYAKGNNKAVESDYNKKRLVCNTDADGTCIKIGTEI